MKDVEIIGMIRTYIEKTLVGMGALKGAPCQVQGTVDEGDGTQTLTLKWEDTAGVTHTTDIILPAALFEVLNPTNGQTLRYNSVSGKFENSNVSFSADLDDLDDVVINSVQNGQVLTYDAANNRWINKDGSTVAALSDLTDVIITTAQDGQFLTYDAANSKWINTTLAIDAGDVNYNNSDSGLEATKVQGAIDELASEKVDKEAGKGLSANDFTDTLKTKLDGIEDGAEVNEIDTVKVNGTALTPDADKAVNIEEKISKLSDVDLTDLADGMILIYDAATNKWYAGANTGASYTAGEGIEIDQNNVISSKMVLFTGTEAQWNALSLADKVKFTHYATSDDQSGQIDPVPTQNSNNLMTSGGIYTALQGKANASDLGTAAAKDSTNAVTQNDTALVESGAVYTALENKADKVSGATNGNIAGLDANGNLTDSGKKASDFATATALTDEIKHRFTNNCKNVLPIRIANQTARGVTFTRNVNDSYSLSGTCTGNPLAIDLFSESVYTNTGDSSAFKIEKGIVIDKTKPYILTRGDTQIRFTLALYQDGVSVATVGFDSTGGNPFMEIDFSSYTFNEIKAIVRFGNNTSYSNKTFTPMLCLKSDYQIDSSQQYFAKTNKQLTDDSVDWESNSVLGAKNFLTNKGTATTQGVEFAVDSNGVFTVTRKSAGSSHAYYSNGRFTLKPGTYIFSNGYNSLPSGIQATYLYNHTDGAYFINCNDGPKTFTITEEKELAFNIEVQTTQSPSGVKIYPMIRLASDNDATYQPYAKTNRELTEELTVSKGAPTENTDYIASSDLHYEKYGKVVHVFGNFETNTAILGTDALVTLFTNLPNSNGGMNGTSSQYTLCLLHDNTNDGLSYRCFVSNEGKLVSRYKAIPIGTYFADFTYICQ